MGCSSRGVHFGIIALHGVDERSMIRSQSVSSLLIYLLLWKYMRHFSQGSGVGNEMEMEMEMAMAMDGNVRED